MKGLVAADGANAYTLAKKFSSDAKGALGTAVNDVLISKGTEADFDFISAAYKNAPASFEKVGMTTKYADYLAKLSSTANIKKGIDDIMAFRNLIPAQFRGQVDPGFKAAMDKIAKGKGAEIAEYVKSVFK